MLIQFDKLVRIAHTLQVAHEVGPAYDHRATAIVGVETERFGALQTFVKEQVDMVFLIVYQAKGAHAARFQPQIAFHTLCRGKAELAGRRQSARLEVRLETLFQLPDVQCGVAVETHQIMPVTLVVAQENVLAMHAAVVLPPPLGLLDGLALGVVVARVWYVMRSQVIQHLFLSFHVCFKMF